MIDLSNIDIKGPGKQVWASIDRLAFLKDFPLTPNRKLAGKYGISRTSCYLIGKKLGLEKSHGLTGQFKSGDLSFNKGKKQCEYMSKEAIERTKDTRFKKGRLPHNTLVDGAISIRRDSGTDISYKYIRLEMGVWDLLHRVVWRKHHPTEELTKEDIIMFKDGDQMNCTVENLYKATREECMAKNSITNLSDSSVAAYLSRKDPELKNELLNHKGLLDLKRQQLLLNRKIRKHEH